MLEIKNHSLIVLEKCTFAKILLNYKLDIIQKILVEQKKNKFNKKILNLNNKRKKIKRNKR
jgi:hypothetical protein